jgi:acyl-[acyl-carrier-protein]-phospholipid O-acyltransferase/long-chain-fatty-acid--[acyl-carrier-protein] ligase
MLYFTQISLFLLLYVPLRLVLKKTKITIDKKLNLSNKPLIVVLNHHAKIDSLLILLLPVSLIFNLVPLKFLTAEHYYKKLWLKLIIKPFGAYCLKKYSWTYEQLFEESLSILHKKENILIYPEGRVVIQTEKVPAKPGLGFLVHKAQAKILPIHIIGSETLTWKNILLGSYTLRLIVGREFKPKKRSNYLKIANEIMQKVYSL